MTARTKYRLIIVLIAFGMLGYAYFGVTALIDPAQLTHEGGVVDENGKLFAQYMGIRNLAMIVLAVIILAKKELKVLAYFLLLSGIIQAGDTVLGAIHNDPMSTIFPAIFAILYFLSTRFLLTNRGLLSRKNRQL